MTSHLNDPFGGKMSVPVIAAPMFLVSSPKLVIEACQSGIIGSFPLLNARTTDILEQWMQQIVEELSQVEDSLTDHDMSPWAVNIIVHRSNKRFDADLEVVKKYKPPIVITSLGHPKRVVDVVHAYGGKVYCDVATLEHAKKASQTGVDGLILVCNGAGGHAGTLNPFAFIGAVKKFWKGTTIIAGCISCGEDVLAAVALGADYAYMGTRFIAATESFAPQEYKQMLIDSEADDLIYTDAFSGIYANYLLPSVKNAGINTEDLHKKEGLDFSFLDTSNAKAWKDIWSAGQGVSTINQVNSVQDIVQQLQKEYEQARKTIS